MKTTHDDILNYLNPKRIAMLEELNIDVFQGNKKIAVDCKTVFINAVIKCSNLNDDNLKLTQKDVSWYFNISEQSLYGYLERHSKRYRDDLEYRSLSDYWNEKFCYSDSVENKEYFKRQLIQIAKNNSERQCKKMINVLIEHGYIISTENTITLEELKVE
tara:strand:+ start:1367 stop:1846 length:480 start_codon:yes stop_codon:yes gene_type:complete